MRLSVCFSFHLVPFVVNVDGRSAEDTWRVDFNRRFRGMSLRLLCLILKDVRFRDLLPHLRSGASGCLRGTPALPPGYPRGYLHEYSMGAPGSSGGNPGACPGHSLRCFPAVPWGTSWGARGALVFASFWFVVVYISRSFGMLLVGLRLQFCSF